MPSKAGIHRRLVNVNPCGPQLRRQKDGCRGFNVRTIDSRLNGRPLIKTPVKGCSEPELELVGGPILIRERGQL